MVILIILLILSVISLLVFIKLVIDLDKRIAELERKISNLQYQTDDVLNDISIMNQNVCDTYCLLCRTKDENN